MLDTTRDVVRKSLLAMLGAITLADDELEQLLDRLAARGEQVARDRFSHIEALRNRLTGSEGAAREGLYEGALLRQTLREEIERQGRLLAAALDLPTRDSINLLREQIEQISLAIDQIVTQHTPVIAPIDNGQAPAPAPATPCPPTSGRDPRACRSPTGSGRDPRACRSPTGSGRDPRACRSPTGSGRDPRACRSPTGSGRDPRACRSPTGSGRDPRACRSPTGSGRDPRACRSPPTGVG
jgi:hypothetical protein